MRIASPTIVAAAAMVATLANGTAFAQIDLTGMWANKGGRFENITEEAAVGDYAGVPVNAAGRLRADTWQPSMLTLPEHQCQPHGGDRIDNISSLNIWKEIDLHTQQLIAYHMRAEWMGHHRVIYMDGRPHPPEHAERTYMGFSTGRWEGDTLVVTTTHLKDSWLKRNGLMRSKKSVSIERFYRNGDFLMQVTQTYDPAYLDEPMFRSGTYKLDPTLPAHGPYPCEAVEEIVREEGVVPHYLPGTNDQLNEWPDRYGIPREAARGGAETLYPEYTETLKKLLKKPGATPR